MRLTPAAASNRIKDLESRFGVRLLTRTTRKLAPTEVGALLYEAASIFKKTVETVPRPERLFASMIFGNLTPTSGRDAMGGEIRFLLNDGEARVGEAGPGDTLLDFLRLERGLKGTKEGCARAIAAPARCWWGGSMTAHSFTSPSTPASAFLPPATAAMS